MKSARYNNGRPGWFTYRAGSFDTTARLHDTWAEAMDEAYEEADFEGHSRVIIDQLARERDEKAIQAYSPGYATIRVVK